MTESLEERINRAEAASCCIINHPASASFNDLIIPNLSTFSGFRLVYSTDNICTNFNGVLLSEIESHCPAISKYFYGNGLLFYSDEVFQELAENDKALFRLDYSISFDTQVAEAFRCYEDNKQVSKWNWFYGLVKIIKERGFNFDYTFYLVEDINNSLDTSNLRPFNTIRALKRLDELDFSRFLANPKQPIFNENRESAGLRAIETLYSFQENDFVKRSHIRRKAIKLNLMKAMQLRWKNKGAFQENLAELIEFSAKELLKFDKLGLYFAWKFLKHGQKHDFFSEILQPHLNAINKIEGMSWDLFSLKHQETMASFSNISHFYIPLIATFDRRFKRLIQACPLRCLLIDDRDGRLNLIFVDEADFFADINIALGSESLRKLFSPTERIARLSKPLIEADAALEKLEDDLRSLIG